MKTICSTLSALSILSIALAGGPAHGQVYQKNDTTPIGPGGVPNLPTILQAVTATSDGGYIAVGSESLHIIHIARYHADGTVAWSKFCPVTPEVTATGIGQQIAPGPGLFAVVGDIGDGLPYGTWFMIIDGAGGLVCSKEINGAGVFTTGRSPTAVRPLSDATFAVTGRAKLAATGPGYGRITKMSAVCGMIWTKLYAPGGLPGLVDCEITDVVEEPGDAYLLGVGTVTMDTGATMPFLLRVLKATGAVVDAKYYGVGDPMMMLRGDGLAQAFTPTGAPDGYVFDGRMSPASPGGPAPLNNYVVKVDMGLMPMWGEMFPEFSPCHACVRAYGSATLVAGTHSTPGGGASGAEAALIDSMGGPMFWGWHYGTGSQTGNGVSITAPAPGSPVGPIIVGTGDGILPGGWLCKSAMAGGSSGGCEFPVPPPGMYSAVIPALFSAVSSQQIRGITLPLIDETLHTLPACVPTPPLGCCDPDFNHDGDIGTDADIEAFFACLGGSCCPACGPADFNCDGDVGTDADIESFFSVLGGGPC
jgi:hypothetical protein